MFTRCKFLDIVGSCNGLVCVSLSENGDDLFLWNPATSQLRKLPTPTISVYYRRPQVALVFGYDPQTKDYKILRIVIQDDVESYDDPCRAEVFTRSTGCRRELKSIASVRPPWRFESRVNYFCHFAASGSLHCLAMYSYMHGDYTRIDRGRFMLSFDVTKEVFSETTIPCYGSPDESCKIHGTDNDSDILRRIRSKHLIPFAAQHHMDRCTYYPSNCRMEKRHLAANGESILLVNKVEDVCDEYCSDATIWYDVWVLKELECSWSKLCKVEEEEMYWRRKSLDYFLGIWRDHRLLFRNSSMELMSFDLVKGDYEDAPEHNECPVKITNYVESMVSVYPD